MTPAARVQAAIEIVDRWLHDGEGLDRIRTAWGREHRFAGSGDRAAIADLVYDAIRRKRSALWVAGAGDTNARDMLAGSLLLDEIDPSTVFTGDRYAPAIRNASGSTAPLQDAPRAVRLDYPDWLEDELAELPDPVLAGLQRRAPLDLRVNTLKTDRDNALAALAREGIGAAPGPLSPTAIRVNQGGRKLSQTDTYADGLVEIQDASSQAVSDMAAAKPGEVILDLCAGGGGKTLALAASSKNEGQIYATDIAPKRLAELPPRARRAGAIVTPLTLQETKRLTGQVDLVLIDAPCSGSGAWRRTPEAKWRLTQEQLQKLVTIQSDLLDQAHRFLKPEGRLLYATCSLLQPENRSQVDAFLDRNQRFDIEGDRTLTPLDGGDGFYAAVLRSRP